MIRSALELLVLLCGTAGIVQAFVRPRRLAQWVLWSAVPNSITNHDSTNHISGQFLFYHGHYCIESEENLCFWCLVPLFIPIGVCVTMHDEGTAGDVINGMWRHNQQATNHFQCSLAMLFTSDDMPWNDWYHEICTSDTMKLEEITLL